MKTFTDAKHWESLEEKHLSRYRLPSWSKTYDRDQFLIWMERLEITHRIFAEIMACTPDQFEEFNHWPIRAMIGLMLEHKESLYAH